jgi:hypothetical protein
MKHLFAALAAAILICFGCSKNTDDMTTAVKAFNEKFAQINQKTNGDPQKFYDEVKKIDVSKLPPQIRSDFQDYTEKLNLAVVDNKPENMNAFLAATKKLNDSTYEYLSLHGTPQK